MPAHELAPGDIILVSTGSKISAPKGSGPIAKLLWDAGQTIYRAASPRLQGSLTHAMLYTGDGNIVEAADHGVVERSFRAATLKKAYLVLRPEVTADQRKKAASFARAQVGKTYDDVGMVGAGIALFLPKVISQKILTNLVDSPSDPTHLEAFQCAGLVSAAYKSSGVELQKDIPWRFAAPAHLLANTNNEPIKLEGKGKDVQAPSFLSRTRTQVKQQLSKVAVQSFYDELEKVGKAKPHQFQAPTKKLINQVRQGISELPDDQRKKAQDLADRIGEKDLTKVLHAIRRWYSHNSAAMGRKVLQHRDELQGAMELDPKKVPELYRGFKLKLRDPFLQELEVGKSIQVLVKRNDTFSSWTANREIANRFSGATKGMVGVVIALDDQKALPVIAPPSHSADWFNALYEKTMGKSFRLKEQEYVLHAPAVQAKVVALKRK